MHSEGYFNEHDEPCLSVDLGSGAIKVLIDTGFSGSLWDYDVREALLGGQMLEGCRLTVDYAERTVQIEKVA